MGWYDEPFGYKNNESKRYNGKVRLWEDTTYYANWRNEEQFKVTINGNDDTEIYLQEGDYIFNYLTKSSSTLYEYKYYIGNVLVDENTRMPDHEVVITCIQESKRLKFILDGNGGTINGKKTASYNCSATDAIPVAESEGQYFGGWSIYATTPVLVTEEKNGKYYFAENFMTYYFPNCTLCAVWLTGTEVLKKYYNYTTTMGGVITVSKYKGSEKNVKIPNGVNNIGDSTFSKNTTITSVTIPDSVTSIGERAFYNCTGLTSVTIGSGVASIGEGAFSGCSSLNSITIPFVGAKAGVTSGDKYQYPFGYIFGTSNYTGGTATTQYYYGSSTSWTTNTIYYIPSSLKSVTVTGGNYISSGAFYNCTGLTSITIPTNVTSIGDYAFKKCTGLTSIIISDGVTSIGHEAFENCEKLTNITIPDSVTSIGDYAFYCTGLTSVTIPDSVTSIGGGAFHGCEGLTSVTIGSGVTSIGDGAFSGCTELTTITVSSNNTKYHSAGNCLIETKSKTLISGCKNSVIPDDGSVTSIGSSAFSRCSGLTSITIPDSVTSIGWNAFYDCTGLASIVFKDTTTWYVTLHYSDWKNKTGGTQTSVTDSSTNATYFKDTYKTYYWYKL